MNVLITGICGFVGSLLARSLKEAGTPWKLVGIDNLARAGSESNRLALRRLGIRLQHGDLRCQSDLETFDNVDWVIDAAAMPSVLAGIEGEISSRQLVEHNLLATSNVLELCKRCHAGFIMLSTSRVYSISELCRLPLQVAGNAFQLQPNASYPNAVTADGIGECFNTRPPLSLYGTSKIAAEYLALEYGAAFDFPVWINRCGVLAGAGQFGRADQGIFSFWIHAWAQKMPLRYIGFGGKGHQVRDALHPRDLVPLLQQQMNVRTMDGRAQVINIGGKMGNSLSLAQLSEWCAERFGVLPIGTEPATRSFDVPWLVLDTAEAHRQWGWQPFTPIHDILEEIARHAEANPQWLTAST